MDQVNELRETAALLRESGAAALGRRAVREFNKTGSVSRKTAQRLNAKWANAAARQGGDAMPRGTQQVISRMKAGVSGKVGRDASDRVVHSVSDVARGRA